MRVSASHSKASAPSAHVLLGHRHGRGAVAGHDLGEAGEPRDGRERSLLAQERGHLEIRVEPGLESAVHLEDQPLGEDHGSVRLVRAEIPFRASSDLRGAPGYDVGESGSRPADEGGPDRGIAGGGRGTGRRGRVLRDHGQGRDDPPLPHRDAQRPPRPVAGHGLTERRPGEREGIRLATAVVEGQRDHGQHVRPGLVQDERLVEGRPDDRATLRAEPASVPDRLEVEPPDGGLDLRARAQILSITCLTTV